MRIDLTREPLGNDSQGSPVYLKDIWPSNHEIAQQVLQVSQGMFSKEYAQVFAGTRDWQAIQVPASQTYQWQPDSTYVKHPPFFDHMLSTASPIKDIRGAHILALLGDSVTTDHILRLVRLNPIVPRVYICKSRVLPYLTLILMAQDVVIMR